MERHRAAPDPRRCRRGAVHLQRSPRRQARGHPRRPARRRPAAPRRPHPRRRPCPGRAASPRPRRCALAPGAARAPGCAARMLGWDGQLEDDARLVTTIARTAAAYGAHVRTRARVARGDRHRGRAARRAHRRDPRRHRPRGRQRHRRLGRRPRRGGHAAPQPRHPPGAARPRRCPGLQVVGLRAGARRDQPLRVRAPPARRHDLRRPHRRARRRARCPTSRADRARDRLPARRGRRRRSTGRCTAPTWSGAYAGLRPLLDVAGDGPTTADLSRRHAVLTAAPAWSRSSAAS